MKRKSKQSPDIKVLDYARLYLSRGFSVIPVAKGTKKPALTSWKEFQERHATDEELTAWFGNGNQNAIGIVTGVISGIAVVDLDSSEAVEFSRSHDFPPTPLVKTGKGYHAYYRYTPGIRNFQKRDDLPGIDLRGDGGFVVAPPSIHVSGHSYQWVEGKGLDDLPLAELPSIILAKRPEHKTSLGDLYRGVERGSRNDSLTRLAGSWVNDGLSFDECLDMAQIWNSKNKLPLSGKEIERTVNSIFKKHHADTVKEDPAECLKTDLLSSLLKWNDILSLDVKTEYLLEKTLPKNSITLLFGRGGVGKTSLCMQIAKAIAQGLSFDALSTMKSPVYYVDFENPLTVLKERVEKIGPCEDLYVWHISNEVQPPKLDSKGWDLYKQLPPGLLIFDTLRASHLSDENNSQDMSLIMGRLKVLREMGFTIFLLHHTPKGNDSIFKGSTAILDLCDHVLSLEEVRYPEEEHIEFDCGNLFRFGTRIKTRYEPHSIYLTFKPEIKGFVIAVDPELERLSAVRQIMLREKEPMNQKTIRKKILEELDYPDKETRQLLKKGTGSYWTTSKGEKNATFYTPLVPVCQFEEHIYTGQTENLGSSREEGPLVCNSSDDSHAPQNTEFGSLSEGSGQTDIEEIIDLDRKEVEIVE